ncbi:MAG: NAD(P)/FAD-dependent oxidoreductase [Clostridia bacterium]|nr:NAD(P)/FAD-dependent oxidoreductase [Clostridia bacterium]
MENFDVLVIGGGAAGLLAAGTAAANGAVTAIIEKNEKLGKKLYITGKGRCNVTNAADISEFIANTPTNGRFLYSAFSAFSNTDLISLLERYGVTTKTERGGRVFPESDKSSDIISALSKYAQEANVKQIRANISEILIENNKVVGAKTDKGEKIFAKKVILATGGASYPQTGSTGDGYKMAETAGHSIVSPKPSLVPLVCREKYVSELMGLSLRNASICVKNANGKEIYNDFGEMLFTHYGVSGPIILSASAHMKDFSKPYTITIDLKPALNHEVLDKRILRDFSELKNKDFANSLDALLPKKLIPVIVRLSGIEPHKKVHDITKEERTALVNLLKALPLTIIGTRPIAEAIITSGGINIKEINPKTMESKLINGLYFAGEIIDVDAVTGGFNLQIAFSTGYLAGESSAQACFDF